MNNLRRGAARRARTVGWTAKLSTILNAAWWTMILSTLLLALVLGSCGDLPTYWEPWDAQAQLGCRTLAEIDAARPWTKADETVSLAWMYLQEYFEGYDEFPADIWVCYSEGCPLGGRTPVGYYDAGEGLVCLNIYRWADDDIQTPGHELCHILTPNQRLADLCGRYVEEQRAAETPITPPDLDGDYVEARP